MSACWDLLLNECCFKTLSSIFPSTVYHCWPTYVYYSKSISVMCSSSASGEVSSHQHWRWVSHSVLRSSCLAPCHLLPPPPYWLLKPLVYGPRLSGFSQFSSLHCNQCLAYESWTSCSWTALYLQASQPLPDLWALAHALSWCRTLSPQRLLFLLTSYSLQLQLNPLLLESCPDPRDWHPRTHLLLYSAHNIIITLTHPMSASFSQGMCYVIHHTLSSKKPSI